MPKQSSSYSTLKGFKWLKSHGYTKTDLYATLWLAQASGSVERTLASVAQCHSFLDPVARDYLETIARAAIGYDKPILPLNDGTGRLTKRCFNDLKNAYFDIYPNHSLRLSSDTEFYYTAYSYLSD